MKSISSSKTKHAHVRISEKDDGYIMRKRLSKTEIFDLGLRIAKIVIKEGLEEIYYEDKQGNKKTLTLED